MGKRRLRLYCAALLQYLVRYKLWNLKDTDLDALNLLGAFRDGFGQAIHVPIHAVENDLQIDHLNLPICR
jgi:hypothetical protein